MMEREDHDLLAEFARTGSEHAFNTLTARHVNLVYSAALRFCNNPHHAEEISQAVFIVLARKAGSLRRSVVLSGWLYQTARLTAMNFMKGEIRRQRREQEAYMQSTLNEPNTNAWTQIAPLLDEAMGGLPDADRNALVLRYFENKSSAEVAAAMKLTEATAHKRVSRALEKLRRIFAKRGVTYSVTAIAGAVAANSVQAAPGTLSTTISTVALAKGATAGSSTFILAKGAIKIMAWTKVKTVAVVTISSILLVGGTVSLGVMAMHSTAFHSGPSDGVTASEITAKSRAAYAALTSYSDEGSVTGNIGKTPVPPHTFSTKLGRPNLYHVEWRQESVGNFVTEGAVWNTGDGDYLRMFGNDQKLQNRESALGVAIGVSGGATSSIPGAFFTMNWGNRMAETLKSPERKADEKIDGVDCYVLMKNTDKGSQTIWIGKPDFLIRQVENDTSAKEMKKIMDGQVKQHPEIASAGNMLKMMPQGDVKSVETHRNIEVNPTLTASDFVPKEKK